MKNVIKIQLIIFTLILLSVSLIGIFHIKNVSGTENNIVKTFIVSDVESKESGKDAPTEVQTFIIEPIEKASPADRIQPEDIHIYKNQIVIDVDSAYISAFTDTNSMDPILDIEANAIQIVPKSVNDIFIGDIISYNTPFAENRIIHRVIRIGEDESGWYAITKGDNLGTEDPYKVRFENIKRIVIGILY